MLLSRYQEMPFTELKTKKRKPSNTLQLVVMVYLFVIFLGFLFLSLPIAQKQPVSFIDTLFTACSAACVTGLSVVNIAESYTHFGHWVLLLLMQIGGLGIITLSTSLILLAGMRPSFNQQSVFLSSFSTQDNIDTKKLLKAIIPFTLTLQAIGLVVYFSQFNVPSLYDRFFYALFQSISSFCNVGFSLLPNSLISYRGNFAINFITAILVISGAFGFLAATELRHAFSYKKKKWKKISLHTKIAASGTLILILLGLLVFGSIEFSKSLANLPLHEKLYSVFFLSTISKTSGLNSIDLSSLTLSSSFFMIFLMTIGANPGSAGGGIKTTTTAIIVLLGINRLLGRQKNQVFGKNIPESTVDKATHVFIVSIAVLILASFVLLITEARAGTVNSNPSLFLKIIFEVASAYSTCGLSLDFTPQLSNAGRIVIVLIMFIGRLGPLFLISAVSRHHSNSGVYFAEEDVMVG